MSLNLGILALSLSPNSSPRKDIQMAVYTVVVAFEVDTVDPYEAAKLVDTSFYVLDEDGTGYDFEILDIIDSNVE